MHSKESNFEADLPWRNNNLLFLYRSYADLQPHTTKEMQILIAVCGYHSNSIPDDAAK
jgi:hypothetical protein